MTILHATSSDDLQAILDGLTKPATIYLAAGVYNVKLNISVNGVRLVGQDRETTVITYSDFARKKHSDGGEYNTFRTYTVCVTGENVSIENLTIANSNTSPEVLGQCVALSVNARTFRAHNVTLKSTQDTLFTAPFPDDLVIRYSGLTDDPAYYDGFIPREQLYMEGESFHLFSDCKICGTVDFIFGGARALFENCEIVSLNETRGIGYVAAPSHSLKQKLGYLFYRCNFTDGGAGSKSVYLARPWRDFGKCDFIDCTVGSHVSPALFDKWNDTYRDKTARFAFYKLHTDKNSPLAPVPWAKELTKAQANDIINTFNRLKMEYFGEK